MSSEQLYKPQYAPWVVAVVTGVFGPLIGACFAYRWARNADEVGEQGKYVWQVWAIASVAALVAYAWLYSRA